MSVCDQSESADGTPLLQRGRFSSVGRKLKPKGRREPPWFLAIYAAVFVAVNDDPARTVREYIRVERERERFACVGRLHAHTKPFEIRTAKPFNNLCAPTGGDVSIINRPVGACVVTSVIYVRCLRVERPSYRWIINLYSRVTFARRRPSGFADSLTEEIRRRRRGVISRPCEMPNRTRFTTRSS